MKIASNFCSDEGFNNLPFDTLNPNAILLSQTNNGKPLPMESDWCSLDDLNFINTPFEHIYTKTVVIKQAPITLQKNCFGFVLCTNDVDKYVIISNILPIFDTVTSIGPTKTTKGKVIGLYITAINEHLIFIISEALSKIC